MIVDDDLARIGSANFSHRSMGTDTECDLAVDAGGDSQVRAGIRRIRGRLLAEHLDMPVDAVAREMNQRRSLGELIDARESGDRSLVRIQMADEATVPSAVLQAAADPYEPVAFGSLVEPLVPVFDAGAVRTPLRIWIVPSVVLLAAAAVVWKSSSLGLIPASASSVWVGIGVFVLGGVLLIPLEFLALAAGVYFGAVRGAGVALAGSVAAAVIGYLAGRAIGPAGLTKWISGRSYRSVRQLNARGLAGVIVLRLASVASAGSIHLLSGAGRVPFAIYMIGTAIGLAPVVAALGGLGGLLRRTLSSPTLSNGLTTIAAAVLLIAATSGLRAILLFLRFASAVSSQRDRAEFG
jgi:uncharacterized membrane protein YdjX (TVP38/TMEM64 family)